MSGSISDAGEGQGWGRRLARACPFVWVARARGRWRFVLLLAECLVAAVLGAWLGRALGLRNLPDVGEPIEAAAVRARLSELRSEVRSQGTLYAATLKAYDRARTAAVARATAAPRANQVDSQVVRDWIASNHRVLELFEAESAETGPGPSRKQAVPFQLRDVAALVVAEAAGAEAANDLDAAWRNYRAVLRASRRLARNGTMPDRHLAASLRGLVLPRIPRWASLPGNTSARIRGALDDVLALDAIVPDDTQAFVDSYALSRLQLETPDGPRAHQRSDGAYVFLGVPVPGDFGLALLRLDRYLHREPERSRRVMRLAFANWHAWASLPPAERPRPAASVQATYGRVSQRVDFFTFPPEAAVPAAARALPAMELAEAFAAAPEAAMLTGWGWTMLVGEIRRQRRDQAALVTSLAEALYQRDHGEPAPNLEALVGPYLQALPDDGATSLDDGATPVVTVEFSP